MIPNHLGLAAALAAGLPGALVAQQPVPGERVRGRYCEAAACRDIEGTFLSQDADSVYLSARIEGVTSPRTIVIRHARVVRGRSRKTLPGALLGAVGGIGIGLLVQGDSCGEGCGIPVVAGAGAGLAVGTIAGLMISSDRWVPLQVSSRGTSIVEMGVGPVGGALGLGLRLAF